RAGDEVRSWFGDEEAERRRHQDELEQDRYYGGGSGRWRSAYDSDDYDRGHSRWDYAPGGYSSRGGGGRASGYSTSTARAGRDRYSPLRGDTYRENSSIRDDPYYHEWRSREIAALDRDYDEYRRENQSRFENDFGSWRNTRTNQRRQLDQVREHQEVVGSDGKHVGTVDHVRGDRILLTKNDESAGGHHHSIPCSWVSKVGDKVELNRTCDAALQAWKDEERRNAFAANQYDEDGPHILNRSFAGTY
ncbi:MAG: DUF2171 domain-containing protein, partial [Sphingomonadaceae bacterium]